MTSWMPDARMASGIHEVTEDSVTTSGSGLDPDISPTYAHLQAARVAAARGVAPAEVERLIDGQVQTPFLGFIGQPRVNVLMTNLALDAALAKAHPKH